MYNKREEAVAYREKKGEESMENSRNAGNTSLQERGESAPQTEKNLIEKAIDSGYSFFYLTGAQLIRRYRRYKKRVSRWMVTTYLSAKLQLQRRTNMWVRELKFKMNDAARPYRKVKQLWASRKETLAELEPQGKKAVQKHWMLILRETLAVVWRSFCTAFNYLAPVVSLILLISLVHHYTNLQFALAVEYNDKMIGYIEKESDFDESEKIVQSRIVYEKYQPPVDTVPKYTLVVIDEEELSTKNEIADQIIMNSGNEITQATGVYVDGEFLGAVRLEQPIWSLLDGMLAEHRTGAENEQVGFVEDVQLTRGLYLLSSLVFESEMKDTLTKEVEGEVVYITQPGDAPTLIAQKMDVPYSQVKALNPGIEEKLLIGQEVLISNQVNFLTVKRTVTEVYEEDIPFGSQRQVSANYPQGYVAVAKSGILGKRMVTADVTYVNGQEVEREELASVTMKAPVDQILTVGTAEPIQVLSQSQTGGKSFIWPVDGGRYSCGINGYWGHTGMDISAPYGTIIRASAAGTVVKAVRQYYNYGIHVKLSHGNGIYTLYAHMSQLACSYGDYVQQGEIIGYVGSTGNSTGNHCHFEIIINGRFMDPAKYIGTWYPGR